MEHVVKQSSSRLGGFHQLCSRETLRFFACVPLAAKKHVATKTHEVNLGKLRTAMVYDFLHFAQLTRAHDHCARTEFPTDSMNNLRTNHSTATEYQIRLTFVDCHDSVV